MAGSGIPLKYYLGSNSQELCAATKGHVRQGPEAELTRAERGASTIAARLRSGRPASAARPTMGRGKTPQAIRNAVEAELASARYYALLAESTDEPGCRAFLMRIRERELEHAHDIEESGIEFIGRLPPHANCSVEVVETLPEWKYVEGMSLDQALEVALLAEQSAALFYEALAEQLEGDGREFFRKLAATEHDHAAEIEEERERLSRGLSPRD